VLPWKALTDAARSFVTAPPPAGGGLGTPARPLAAPQAPGTPATREWGLPGFASVPQVDCWGREKCHHSITEPTCVALHQPLISPALLCAPPPPPLPPAAGVPPASNSPLRPGAVSSAPRLPNGSLPAAAAAAAAASPAPALSTLSLLDHISRACLGAQLPPELLGDAEFGFLTREGSV
jgi:hypothetical protein